MLDVWAVLGFTFFLVAQDNYVTVTNSRITHHIWRQQVLGDTALCLNQVYKILGKVVNNVSRANCEL